MAAATPAPPPAARAARPAYWFPLALFGALVALSVPLYASPLDTSPAFSGWAAYAPLTRAVSSSPSSANAAYSSTLSLTVNAHTGLPGIAQGWYWAAALTAGFLVTMVWYRRPGRRDGAGKPGWDYLGTGLLLTAVATAVPLLVMPRASFPAWLWLSGQWASGTFALLIIAVALWMLAVYARSRPLAIVALAYTAAALVADWPTLSSAPSALLMTGGDPARTLVSIGSRAQSAEAALLPAAVLLVAAAVAFALPARFRGQPQAG
ncbi:MAG: hypothetical protein ACR2MP_12675 [Streptosporangiaceae bacterium]